MTPILSPQKRLEAVMSTDNPLRDQSRAIQQQPRPTPRNETPREARWRVERERSAEQAKREPHKGYSE